MDYKLSLTFKIRSQMKQLILLVLLVWLLPLNSFTQKSADLLESRTVWESSRLLFDDQGNRLLDSPTKETLLNLGNGIHIPILSRNFESLRDIIYAEKVFRLISGDTVLLIAVSSLSESNEYKSLMSFRFHIDGTPEGATLIESSAFTGTEIQKIQLENGNFVFDNNPLIPNFEKLELRFISVDPDTFTVKLLGGKYGGYTLIYTPSSVEPKLVVDEKA